MCASTYFTQFNLSSLVIGSVANASHKTLALAPDKPEHQEQFMDQGFG